MSVSPKTPEPAHGLQRLITFRLARLQARANAQAAKILKKHAGVSLSEWRIFVIIEATGKTSPAQIVRLTGFNKAAISRTIKRMEEKKLVTVEVSASDHRTHIVDLTPKGIALFEQARSPMKKRQDMFRQVLDVKELEQLHLAFDKIDGLMTEMEDGFTP